MWQYAIALQLALVLAFPTAVRGAAEEAPLAHQWQVLSPDENVVLTIQLGADQQGTTRLSWRVELAGRDSRSWELNSLV